MKKRMIKKTIIALLKILFTLITLTCMIKFICADEVFPKIEWGIYFLVCLILILRE